MNLVHQLLSRILFFGCGVGSKGNFMPPKPFYEIAPKTYLFGKSLSNDIVIKNKKTPEEKVRQWVLFELLSTYGYHINDIKIEVPAKMGRGYHPADIVIYKDHQPLIVIECKKVGSNEQDEALKQVITYAAGLKAQFAVYVDGESWVAKRFLSGHWIDINDIPPNNKLSSQNSFPAMLLFIEHVKPLLYWLHKTIPAKDTPKFFRHLDVFIFFIGFNYLRGVNDNLHFGVNSITKILFQQSSEPENKLFLVDDYKRKNFLIAISFFQKYLDDIGSEGYLIRDLNFDNFTFKEAVDQLFVELNTLALNLSNMISKEISFLRLAVVLIQYLREALEKSEYPPVESVITNELYSLVNLILMTEFGASLPDSIDINNVKELIGLSAETWIERKN